MTHEEIAGGLLTPLWRGIPADYKRKYARNIWEQFQNNIRSAAYTARAPQFLSRLVTRLGIVFGPRDAAQVSDIINAGRDRELLKMLREDTTLLVLLVRVANEEKKEAYKQRQAAKERDGNLDL